MLYIVTSENIMISDFGAKNYRITELCVLSVSEFDVKSYPTS